MKKNLLFPFLLCSALFSSCGREAPLQGTGYSGEDVTQDFIIKRDRMTRKTTLKVTRDVPWTLYAGPAPAQIDLCRPIARGKSAGIYDIEVPTGRRWYFQIVSERGNAILAERRLPLSGSYNTRDIGGIRTADGRYTRWGMLYRSDELNNLSGEDIRFMTQLGLQTVLDLRSQQEIAKSPDNLPEGINYVRLPISPGNLEAAASSVFRMSSSQLEGMMMEVNTLLVEDSVSIERYRELFRYVQDSASTPILYHCTAGKDRTGMATALILYSLGVDEETIMEDYLCSNHYLEGKYADAVKQVPSLRPLIEVRRQYLQAGIDSIRSAYGNIDHYLREVLGVDTDQMKKLYLE